MSRRVNALCRILMGVTLMIPGSTATPQEVENSTQKQAAAELLSLHKDERRAHFDHDVKFMLAHLAPQLLDVRDGRVNRMSSEDVRKRFLEYFQDSQFSNWDDVEPPVVRVSADGKMAWMIVRVRIAYTDKSKTGKATHQEPVAAWMSAYEKKNGTWLLTAVASTFAEN